MQYSALYPDYWLVHFRDICLSQGTKMQANPVYYDELEHFAISAVDETNPKMLNGINLAAI